MFTTPVERLPKTVHLIREGASHKLHLGMQVYISQAGETLADFALGQNAPNESLLPQTLCCWLSSGKPLTAAAVLMFAERRRLRLSDPVCHYVPAFAAHGKGEITLLQMLTHTAGLRPVSSGWPHAKWREIIAKICDSPLRRNWTPGEQAAYDPNLSWFILGEVLRKLDGRKIDQIVREELLEPLEMLDCWMTVPKHLHAAYGDRIGLLYSLKDQEFQAVPTHDVAACQAPSPGSSMRGPIAQLARFYEMLLRGGTTATGKRLLSQESVQLMTSRHRTGMHDLTFQHPVDFGLGVIVNSNRYGPETVPYGFGRYASDESFGHGGAQSSIGFADPRHQLVVAAVANGCPGEELHNRRFRDILSAIYEDLGLATARESTAESVGK